MDQKNTETLKKTETPKKSGTLKKMTLKNCRMMEMANSLQPILTHRDKLGYYAARNTRILRDTLTEYITIRDQAFRKYGTPKPDTNQLVLNPRSPVFQKFCDEMVPFDNIEHEVSLHICKFEDAIDCLTGEEILAIDWMLED